MSFSYTAIPQNGGNNIPGRENLLSGKAPRIRQDKRSKIPNKPLVYEDWKDTCEKLISQVEIRGLQIELKVDEPLKNHLEFFREKLILWEQIPINKCLSAQEIFIGSLGGPAFAEFIKKCRTYSYINAVSEGQEGIPEEFVLPGYKGYDSIFHESDLIHWQEETSDMTYAFQPLKRVDYTGFRDEAKAFIDELYPDTKDFKYPEVNTFQWIKASRCYNPQSDKGISTRDGFLNLHSIRPGYFGKRVKVQVHPAGVRDCAMADPNTLAKIKLCHAVFSQLCERASESGMSSKLNKNLSKVLDKKIFHHIDLKKAGIYLPRRFLTILGDLLEEKFEKDFWFIKDLREVFLLDEDNTYYLDRGYCLGWANEGLTLVLIILLRMFQKKHTLDWKFIVFNDDILIGDQDKDILTYSVILKFTLLEFFNSHDILLSIKKCFTSKSAQFLEEYFYTDFYKVNMDKRQIATRLYAKAYFAEFPWKSKMYVEVAVRHWRNQDMIDRIIEKVGYEHSEDEPEWPYLAGGWVTPMRNGLDTTLEYLSTRKYLVSLKKIRVPLIADRMESFNDNKSYDKLCYLMANAKKRFNEPHPDLIEDIKDNDPREWAGIAETYCDSYLGNKVLLPSRALEIIKGYNANTPETG
jgi:hypothetical protein